MGEGLHLSAEDAADEAAAAALDEAEAAVAANLDAFRASLQLLDAERYTVRGVYGAGGAGTVFK